jgi:hypothetical protein
MMRGKGAGDIEAGFTRLGCSLDNSELSPAPQSAGLERRVRHFSGGGRYTSLRVDESFFDMTCDASLPLS